jgi:hypothetical protein
MIEVVSPGQRRQASYAYDMKFTIPIFVLRTYSTTAFKAKLDSAMNYILSSSSPFAFQLALAVPVKVIFISPLATHLNGFSMTCVIRALRGSIRFSTLKII